MLFGSKKSKNVSQKRVKPIVVRTDHVGTELSKIAKDYDVKVESLDFNLLDVQTFTRISLDGKNGEWEEIAKDALHDIDSTLLLDKRFQIHQIYEIEVFSKNKIKEPIDDFKIAIGANATKCKVYMQIKAGSTLKYFNGIKDVLRLYIDKHKLRAGILIYIFDEMMDDVVSKLTASAQVQELIKYDKTENILIAQSIEPSPTIDGTLVLHYEKKDEEKKDKVDYSNRDYIQSVYKDELLIEYIKPKAGKPGRDCRGIFIEPKKPKEKAPITFNVDEATIYVKEDAESIKYYAKENGYIAFENNTYIIKSEADINQISFKTTGSITVGVDSDVSLVVTEKNAVKDAIGTGMEVEVTEIEIEGNVGSNAKVKAKKAKIGGQTHKSSSIEADELEINVHKGIAKGNEVKVTRLEHGSIEAQKVYIGQAIGGVVRAREIIINVCGSYLKASASNLIEIKKMRGSENIFIIDPLVKQDAKDGFGDNQKKIQELEEKLKELKKEIESLTESVKSNLPAFNDLKKRLLHYKKNNVKMPSAFVKQYKIFQAQREKLKKYKEERKIKQDQLNMLTTRTASFQYSITDARIINRDKWVGYNEIKAKLIEPPVELVYKVDEHTHHQVFGVVEVEDEVFKIIPIGSEEE